MKYIFIALMLISTSIKAEEMTLGSNYLSPGSNFKLNYKPNLVINNVVTITSDGKIVYADGYTPDDAAKEFWNAVERMGLKLSCGDK